MKRISLVMLNFMLIGILTLGVLPVSAEEDLRIGDEVNINGMKATIVGFKQGLPIYQFIIAPNIYTSASDGNTHIDNSNYNTARTSATATAITDSQSLGVRNTFEYGNNYEIVRAYLYFNTLSLSGYVVTAGSLNIYVSSKSDTDNESIQIQSGMAAYPHDPLVAGDYDFSNYVTDTDCGNKDITTFTTNAYNSITLDASGIAQVNTSGWTKLCLRTSGDINNVTPTGDNGIYFYSYERGTGYIPYLVITYTALTPAIISVAASNVATTSARLNSTITNDGGDPTCQIEFGYGLVTQTALNYAAYTTHTSVTVPVSDYAEGTNPYLDISGLASGTPYFYRVKVTNELSGIVSTDEQTFTTEAVVGAPSTFNGIPNNTNINLAFVRGTGSTQTLIRYALDACPTTTGGADGTTIYLNTGSNYIHTGLTGGTTYYYSAWGKSGATYSAAINLVMTTTGSIPSHATPTGGTIGGLMQEPDGTFLANLQPFYSVINGLADTWGMPRGNMWLTLVLIFVFAVAGGLYIVFHSAALALVVMAMLMGGFITLHILPTFFLIIIGFCCLGAWATRPNL
jgi:hypothetical protein